MIRSAWKFFCLSLLFLVVAPPTGISAEDKPDRVAGEATVSRGFPADGLVGPFGFGVGVSTFKDVYEQLGTESCKYDKSSAINGGLLVECDSRIFKPRAC